MNPPGTQNKALCVYSMLLWICHSWKNNGLFAWREPAASGFEPQSNQKVFLVLSFQHLIVNLIATDRYNGYGSEKDPCEKGAQKPSLSPTRIFSGSAAASGGTPLSFLNWDVTEQNPEFNVVHSNLATPTPCRQKQVLVWYLSSFYTFFIFVRYYQMIWIMTNLN